VADHQAHHYLQLSHNISISFALEVLKELWSRGYCGKNGEGTKDLNL